MCFVLSFVSFFLACSLFLSPFLTSLFLLLDTVKEDDQLSLDFKTLNLEGDQKTNGNRAQTFTFEELAASTGNFRSDCFVGEGGFGKVYKGYLEKIDQVSLVMN